MKVAFSSFAICLLLSIQPAHACSFSYGRGYSPKEIPYRADVWKVKGDFTLIDAKSGEAVDDGEINLTEGTGELLGQIDRKGRKPVMTKQFFYREWMIDCGMGLTPQQRASGTFWLEKKRDKQGRYRLLMWREAQPDPVSANLSTGPTHGDGKK